MSNEEKVSNHHVVDEAPLPSPSPDHPASSSDGKIEVDDAWKYLDAHREASAQDVEPMEMLPIRRKVDYRIVPLAFILYVMQYTDKLVLNYAGVMTMREDLNLTGNDFSNLATSTYVAVAIWEFPNIYFLQRVPAAKWLAANAIGWGIATACGAAATNYQTMLVTRIFLGIFEATVNPSLMLIAGRWYTKPEQAPRLSFWLMGLGIGQILGGAVSYGFQSLAPGAVKLAGWRIMFLVLGCITIFFGILTWFIMPDNPMAVKWLTPKEKVALLRHISVNQTGVENKRVRVKEIWEALRDPPVWMIWISIFLLASTAGITVAYSATLIRNFGYTPKQATLLNMPAGLVSMTVQAVPAFFIRRGIGHRWAWAIATLIPTMLGSALMSFLPNSNKAGLLAGIYLINCLPGPLTVFWSWAPANIAGATKRAFVTAILAAMSAAGSSTGPQTFQAKDAPDYRPAKITALATQAASGCTIIALFFWYVYQNKHRRKVTDAETREAFMNPEVWERLTDRENKAFRYTY
ncbi:allantoate permease [Cercophora newfieldiana]|uniref:Allantoate permease n=1 Tax=Cercophora newfieldiana TaxID=92897 RepID=A0AA39XVL1_9PEZI|nr:allantoate permease [Cercophora newfieldiana]